MPRTSKAKSRAYTRRPASAASTKAAPPSDNDARAVQVAPPSNKTHGYTQLVRALSVPDPDPDAEFHRHKTRWEVGFSRLLVRVTQREILAANAADLQTAMKARVILKSLREMNAAGELRSYHSHGYVGDRDLYILELLGATPLGTLDELIDIWLSRTTSQMDDLTATELAQAIAKPSGLRPAEKDDAQNRSGRSCADRDEMFLKWYESKDEPTYRSHATIRDKWNAMHPKESVGVGTSGRQVVIKGIERAKDRRLKTRP